MNYLSLIKKLKIIVRFKLFAPRKIFDNVFFIGDEIKKEYKNIVFYFNNPEFMHLGDHLFFEPIIKAINESGKFNVYVMPTSPMISYFKSSGVSVVGSLDETNECLLITRIELFDDVKFNKCDKLLFNNSFYNGNLPICNDIALKISSFLGLNLDISNLKPSKFVPKIDLNLPDGKFYLFSNYVDSSFFRITRAKNEKLVKKAYELKKEGFKIIHIGTKRDKQNDNTIYDFIDIDLRGRTSVEELFYICSLKNIVGGICYDSFIMHLLFIFEKRLFVVFRGRFLHKNSNFFIKKTIPPFFYSGIFCELM